MKNAKRNLDRLDKSDQVLFQLLATTGMRLSEAFETMDQLSDRPRIEPNRVVIENRLARRCEQAHQRNDTERRYAVPGVAPNFERVSQRIFPDESRQ
jgi:hypothetical protein